MGFEKIKDNLSDQLAGAADLNEISKYLTALSLIEGIEKTNVDKRRSEFEIENITYQKKADLKKFIIGVIAPFLTSLALIATVFVQILQTHNNYALQLQKKEDDEWNTFLSKITSPDAKNDLTIPLFLKSFYQSTTYKDKACELTSTTYLPNLNNLEEFNNVFPEYFKIIDANNYGSLVQLTFKLYDHYHSVEAKIPDDSLDLKSANRSDTAMFRYYKKIINEDNILLTNISTELSRVGSGLKDMVNRVNTNTGALNLSQAYFLNINLDNINLKGADLTDAAFDQVSLKNADLSGIKSFDHSDWDNTAWWQAKDLSIDLLKYLVVNYPYSKQQFYFTHSADDEVKYSKWLKNTTKG